MEQKRVYPSASARSAKHVFAEVMEDARYTLASVHDCVPHTRGRPNCPSGVKKLKHLFKGELCSARSVPEWGLSAGKNSSLIIELTGFL